MTKSFASFLPSVVRATVLAAALAFTPSAHAVLYWDANSALGGNGTWDDNTTQNWSTVNAAVAPNSKWTPNDGTVDAAFNGPDAPGYTVTIGTGTTMNAKSVSFGIAATTTARNVIITGGTLNITDPNNSIVMNLNTSGIARQQVIQSALSGTDITVSAGNAVGGVNTFLGLGASGTGTTSTFTGNLIFAGPSTANSGFLQIAFNNPTALPGPAGGSFAGTVTNTTIKMRRNLSQLLFGGAGPPGTNAFTATFNNNIVLNDGQSGTLTQSIGAGSGQAGTAVTLGGVISGNASLGIQLGAPGGGQGTIVLANHSTYTGSTDFNTAAAGVLRLAINDALPTGTTFNFNRGTFDMAGFSQKIAGLNSTSDGAANPIKNSGATKSTLTIDGNVTGTYGGTTLLGGLSDNVELVFASTNTGTLSLTKPSGNPYTGNTTIGGGKLIAASLAGFSATGTGTVAVNNGGTLGGGGAVGDPSTGPVTVASGGHLAPTNDGYDGAVHQTTGVVGTLSVLGNLTLASGARLDMDLSAPVFGASGTSDQVNMPNATALNVPAAANSVGLNFGNPNGLGGNGTYTLMSFQAGQYTGSNVSQFFTASSPSPNNINGATVAYHLADGSNNIVDGTPASATRVIAVVTGGSNQLTWTGSNGTAWDTATTTNFNSATTGTSSQFASNDNVLFDDSAGANTTVAVNAGGVQPNMVAINNSSGTYTFSGGDIKGSSLGGGSTLFLSGTGTATINNNYTASGPITSNKTGNGTATFNGNITAATALTVNGGTVTLAGANTYTGSNTINGGTLSVAADNNLGAVPGSPTAGSIVIAGGGTLKTTASFTLSTNRSITATGTATISNDPTTTLSYGGVVSGTGSLVQTGGGKLVLSGANTYTGNTVVKSTTTGGNSTLAIGADNALPTGTQLNINGVTATGSATFDLSGFSQTVAGIALTGPAGSTGTITNSVGGTAKNFTVTNSTSSFAGTISGNLNLIKNGVDTLALPSTGSFSYTGDTKVLGGTLSINTAYLADAADVYLATGALFNLNFAGSDTIRSLFIDGIGQVTGTWGGTSSGAAHITPLITSTGLLNVTTATGLPGDFNSDGNVDAGDYATWRKNDVANIALANDNGVGNQAARFTLWRANFGKPPGAGSSLGGTNAVPEPASCAMLLMGCVALLFSRRNKSGRAAV